MSVDVPFSKVSRTVYMVLAPTGACDFANMVAEKICTSSTAGGLEESIIEMLGFPIENHMTKDVSIEHFTRRRWSACAYVICRVVEIKVGP